MRDAVKIFHPQQLTTDEQGECVTLIVDGGAVKRAFVEDSFPRSIAVAVKRSGADIVGVGAIKPVRRSYTKKVARKSGVELDPETHELGYVAVKPRHRGLGIAHVIVQKLVSDREATLYATTSNRSMRSLLERSGFVRQGNEWTGDNCNKLSLWVRE